MASWAVLGLWHAHPEDRATPVRIGLFALNACVGVLFLARAPAARTATPLGLASALPSMLLGAVALRMAPLPRAWALAPTISFVAGTALAIAALATLGKSFALLPSLRSAVVSGPFRVVRHPAYAGEMTMIVACGLARSGWHAAGFGALAALLLVPRVLAEEKVLGADERWTAYARRVKWRLVPGVW